jgi:hypothetical protein
MIFQILQIISLCFILALFILSILILIDVFTMVEWQILNLL